MWDCIIGKCINVVLMGGDVGVLIFVKGWLFVGLFNEVKVMF